MLSSTGTCKHIPAGRLRLMHAHMCTDFMSLSKCSWPELRSAQNYLYTRNFASEVWIGMEDTFEKCLFEVKHHSGMLYNLATTHQEHTQWHFGLSSEVLLSIFFQ